MSKRSVKESAALKFDKVCVIGVGLIGGSMAMRMRTEGIAARVTGVGRGRENLEYAVAHGIIDDFSHSIKEGSSGADLVIISTPVLTVRAAAAEAASSCSPDAIMIDVGSTKLNIVNDCEAAAGSRACFVGCHPIAGTEKSGSAAAFPALFEDRWCIITPTDKSDKPAVETVEKLWKCLGSKTVLMSALEHDRLLAHISHLPHMAAFALTAFMADGDLTELVKKYAAGGFKDFTRIASSSPDMWADIALDNASEISASISDFRESLEKIDRMISAADRRGLTEYFAKAKRFRDSVIEHGKEANASNSKRNTKE